MRAVDARDTAGVRLVVNHPPAVLPEPWCIAGRPTLVIPSIGAGYTLNWIHDVAPLANDRLAVANAGSRQVLVFGGAGNLVDTFGGEGSGPGEIRSLSAFMPSEVGGLRRLAVFDLALQRVTVYDPQEGPPLVRRVTAEGGSFQPIASLSGQAWLGELTPEYTAKTEPGVYRDSVRLVVADSLLQRTKAVIGTFPLPPDLVVAVEVDGESQRVDVGLPFFETVKFGVRRDEIVAADPGAGEITFYDLDGRRTARVELGLTARPISAAEIAAHRERELAAARPASRPIIAARYERGAFPTTLPYFDRLVVDPAGFLWLRRFDDQGETSRELIVDPEDRLVGAVALPTGFELFAVGPDEVVGVRTTEAGEESVVSYALDRGAPCNE